MKHLKIIFIGILTVLCQLGLWGQDSTSGTAATTPPATSVDYELMPSDLLRITVFQEDELMREVRVSQNNTITLPLIGTVNLKGLSLGKAEEVIRGMYDKDYLVNPQVNIIVLDYAVRTVNVIGQVNNPGAVQFPPEQGFTLLDAITRAGGFTRLAERKKVKLTRTYVDGHTESYTIDADQIIGGGSSANWQLAVGDVIFIPERFL